MGVRDNNPVSAPAAGRGRERFLDVLRAIATLRVVLYHATGYAQLSWFAAMPLMFFVGGALYGKSLSRTPWRPLLHKRSRRILIPWTAWVVVVALVYALTGEWRNVPWWGAIGFVFPLLPPHGPVGAAAGDLYWTWMALWYISAYLLFMVVGIPLRRLQQRAPWLTLAALAAPVLLGAALGAPALGAPTYNLFFWVLGYCYADGLLTIRSKRLALLTAVACAAVALAYAAAVTGLSLTITESPFLSMAVGCAWVLGALAMSDPITRLARPAFAAYPVEFLKQRALTVYLWHAAAVGITQEIVADRAGEHSRLTFVASTFALTFIITLGVGWLEDYSAGRRAQVWPDLSAARPASVLPEAQIDPRGPLLDSSPGDGTVGTVVLRRGSRRRRAAPAARP